MPHLAPVGGDHVGGGRQPGRAFELGHHLAAGEPALRSHRVLGVGQHVDQPATRPDRVVQQPAAVGVQRDSSLREPFGQGDHRLGLLRRGQHAALQLEVGEPVTRVGRLGQAHDGLRCERLLVPDPQPLVATGILVGRRAVGQIRLGAVPHEEEIAQGLHPGALLTVAQQGGHRHLEMPAQQIEQGGLDGGHGVDHDPQVERLRTPPTRVAVGERGPQRGEHRVVAADAAPDDQRPGVLEGAADRLTAGHLADPGVAVGIGEHHQVSGEERGVGTAEVQQHAVVSRDGDHRHIRDDRGAWVSVHHVPAYDRVRCTSNTFIALIDAATASALVITAQTICRRWPPAAPRGTPCRTPCAGLRRSPPRAPG